MTPANRLVRIGDASALADHLGVPRETTAPLTRYAAMLTRWQKAQNLVANGTLPDMWIRHFLDSAQLYPLILASQGRSQHTGPHRLLDIGSGGGFPGLVLAVMGLVDADLVDSVARKCSFMTQVARETGAAVRAHAVRIEALAPFDADIITARACARLGQLLTWAAPFVTKDTHLYFLKGAIAAEELTEAEASWKMKVRHHQSQTNPCGVILEITDLTAR